MLSFLLQLNCRPPCGFSTAELQSTTLLHGPFSDVLSLPISSLFRDPYVPIRQLSSTSLWMEAVTEAAFRP